uniref:(northern house mosquito) hypothetical protein n=1 Tax=Culex pipiens TaxID=7175 RepID=A0A8D8ATI9_CULPI
MQLQFFQTLFFSMALVVISTHVQLAVHRPPEPRSCRNWSSGLSFLNLQHRRHMRVVVSDENARHSVVVILHRQALQMRKSLDQLRVSQRLSGQVQPFHRPHIVQRISSTLFVSGYI